MSNTATEREAFSPDWAVHPGDVLSERLEAYGMSPAELSRRTGLTKKLISEILSHDNPVSPETAIALGPVLGLTPELWTNLQSEWKLAQARRAARPTDAKAQSFCSLFPVSDLVRRGVLPDTKDVQEIFSGLLALFGIASIEMYAGRRNALAVRHRHSPKYKSSPDHVFAWLQLGELKALQMSLGDYSRQKFEGLVKGQLRGLTVKKPEKFVKEMRDACASAGVAVIVEKPFVGTKLSGSARWLGTGNPVIQLSLRHKTNDHFWFTFFHECGHVLLHPDKTFVDSSDGADVETAEKQADRFAEEVLVGTSSADTPAS